MVRVGKGGLGASFRKEERRRAGLMRRRTEAKGGGLNWRKGVSEGIKFSLN